MGEVFVSKKDDRKSDVGLKKKCNGHAKNESGDVVEHGWKKFSTRIVSEIKVQKEIKKWNSVL